MNADLSEKLASLTKSVQAESDVITSAETLLVGLKAEVDALRSTTTDPAVLAAIDNLSSGIAAKSAELAAAVVANTDTPPPTSVPIV